MRAVAHAVRHCVRPGDLAARFGGEEFILLLTDCGLDDARAVVARLRAQLAALASDGTVPPLTASFGMAASGLTADVQKLLTAADAALFEAKQTGRDRVVEAEVRHLVGADDPASPTDVGPVPQTAPISLGN